jgi:RNA polymerase sigma-70 factor, ECF subfamily
MPAAEAASTLGTSVAAVNSALQRARATLAALPEEQRPTAVEAEQADLLARYVDAFQRYDIDQLVTLLHEDAVMSMPPISMWLRGAENIGQWMGLPGPSQCRGSILVSAGQVNGVQSWAQYKPSPDGGYSAWALLVHEASGGRFTRWTFFLDTPRLFPELGLAAHLP